MGEVTKIEWTATRLPDGEFVTWKGELVNIIPGGTFNPWWGCMAVSPACKFCYAEYFSDHRYGNNHWGPGSTRREFGDKHWNEPLQWDKMAESAGIKMKVFCGSMCDWAEDHPAVGEWRERLFRLIENTPNIIWLLLTKRPENIIKFIPEKWKNTSPKNVWYGTTVENQQYAIERIPHLMKVPAQKRFLSMEPLLGSVDLSNKAINNGYSVPTRYTDEGFGIEWTDPGDAFIGIDWVIVGGESGTQKDIRPMHPFWATRLMYQCKNSNVPFFFKQWGEYGHIENPEERDKHVYVDFSGKIYKEMPGDGSIKSAFLMQRRGKKKAGRILNGEYHNETPK